jgi:hypothetical protein
MYLLHFLSYSLQKGRGNLTEEAAGDGIDAVGLSTWLTSTALGVDVAHIEVACVDVACIVILFLATT